VTRFDPATASEPEAGAGHLPAVLRGYDRQHVDACLGELAASWSRSGAKARTPSSGYASSTRELPWRSPGRPRASTCRSPAAKATKVFDEAGALADRLIASLRNAPPWPGAASDRRCSRR
jgi:hypothetical protein